MRATKYIKPVNSYPRALRDDLQLIKLDKAHSNLRIIGSQSYRPILYPSDIDAIEEYRAPSREQAVHFFSQRIQEMVRTLNQMPNKFFLEVKCGSDPRFSDPKDMDKPYDVFNPNLSHQIAVWSQLGLLSGDEVSQLAQLMKQGSALAYEKIAKMIRNHFVIRWNSSEIAKNRKQLPLGVSVTLDDSINKVGQCNIELISILNGRLVDESNYFLIGYYAPDGNFKYVNLPKEALIDFREWRLQSLRKSMKQVINSKLEYNPIKYAKRLYSYALVLNDTPLMARVEKILNSRLGLIYQIKSEIGTILKLLELKPAHLPMEVLQNQLENIKYRLAGVLIFSNEELKKINQTFEEGKDLTTHLTTLKDYLGQYVNRVTTEMLKQEGLLTPNGQIP